MASRKAPWLKIATHVAGLAPLVGLLWGYWRGLLGPDPIGEATRRTGRLALIFLGLSLLPTVIRLITGFAGAVRVRRALGLYAFMYAALHFLTFIGWDYGFDWALIGLAIRQGRFVLLGLAALIIMVPLAVTSTNGWVKRLGKRWKRLHRLAYVAAVLAVVHYMWVYKELRVAPILAGVGLVLLLLARIPPLARALGRWQPQ